MALGQGLIRVIGIILTVQHINENKWHFSVITPEIVFLKFEIHRYRFNGISYES